MYLFFFSPPCTVSMNNTATSGVAAWTLHTSCTEPATPHWKSSAVMRQVTTVSLEAIPWGGCGTLDFNKVPGSRNCSCYLSLCVCFCHKQPLSAHPQPRVEESSSAALGLEICQIQAAASLRKALKSWQCSLLPSLLHRVCWSPMRSGIKTFRAAPAKQNKWQQPASTSGLWRAPECIRRDEIHTIPSLTRHC